MGRKPRNQTKENLYLHIAQSQRLRASSIVKRFTESGKTTIYKNLKLLLAEGNIIKKGKFPKIYYEAIYDDD